MTPQRQDPLIYVLIGVIALFCWMSYRYSVSVDKMILDKSQPRPVQLYLPN